MKKRIILTTALIVAVIMIIAFSVNASATTVPVLILEAENGELGGPANIRGQKVGNIGYCGGNSEGTITYYDLEVPVDGVYTMCVYYYSGSDDRYFVFSVDGVDTQLDCPSTGSFDIVGTILLDIELKKGATLRIGTDWYGPDLDKIEIYRKGAFDFVDREYTNPDNKQVHAGKYVLHFDENNGVYSIGKNTDGKDISIVVKNAHSEFILDNKIISSDDFKNHKFSELMDKNGFIFEHTGHDGFNGKISEEFIFNSDNSYFTVQIKIEADSTISTNYISALSVYSNSLKIDDGMFLKIPFDNDMWEEPRFIQQYELGHSTTSYEVGAYFSQSTNMSLVCGSISHDTWKSAVNINAEDGNIKAFNLYAGVSDGGTRDKFNHGYVNGKSISSPLMFICIGNNWSDGLELYGKANAEVVPPKASVEDVPFGFNSWGSLSNTVDYSTMNAVSDYIEKYLQDVWKNDGSAVYVNIDSFWDYIHINDINCEMTLDEALAAFVKHCRDNNQKAGIYYTPFAFWGSYEELLVTKMEGSDYTYFDAALRSHDGSKLYGDLDGGYALDPTHPGTIARIEDRFNYFIDLGFEYIKLDFTTHGALEGDHYLDSVTTGIQAYNYGMSKIHDICNGKMFVNLSISPVFPHQYADGRRISCDAFASIDNTRHVLTYVTACFWQKSLYAYPDPDHLLVTGVDESVARVRVTSGVISGTSFIIGDNLAAIKPGSYEHERILKMYANKNIVNVAKEGMMFKPVFNLIVDKCADTYYCVKDGFLYIAVFNFDYDYRDIVVNFSNMVSDASTITTQAVELWSGTKYDVNNGYISFELDSNDAAIFKVSLTGAEITLEPDETDNKTVTPDTTIIDTTIPVTPIPDTTVSDNTAVAPNTSEAPETLKGDSDNSLVITLSVIAIVIVAGAAVIFLIKKKK